MRSCVSRTSARVHSVSSPRARAAWRRRATAAAASSNFCSETSRSISSQSAEAAAGRGATAAFGVADRPGVWRSATTAEARARRKTASPNRRAWKGFDTSLILPVSEPARFRRFRPAVSLQPRHGRTRREFRAYLTSRETMPGLRGTVFASFAVCALAAAPLAATGSKSDEGVRLFDARRLPEARALLEEAV